MTYVSEGRRSLSETLPLTPQGLLALVRPWSGPGQARVRPGSGPGQALATAPILAGDVTADSPHGSGGPESRLERAHREPHQQQAEPRRRFACLHRPARSLARRSGIPAGLQGFDAVPVADGSAALTNLANPKAILVL